MDTRVRCQSAQTLMFNRKFQQQQKRQTFTKTKKTNLIPFNDINKVYLKYPIHQNNLSLLQLVSTSMYPIHDIAVPLRTGISPINRRAQQFEPTPGALKDLGKPEPVSYTAPVTREERIHVSQIQIHSQFFFSKSNLKTDGYKIQLPFKSKTLSL